MSLTTQLTIVSSTDVSGTEGLASTSTIRSRARVNGKFIFAGGEKFYARGAAYGPPQADRAAGEFPSPVDVEGDFAAMSAHGLNALWVCAVPPLWLLDMAHQHGLRVVVDIPWPGRVAFLDDKQLARSIEERVRAGVRACSGHPAVLCYSIGTRIPGAIVRWHGQRSVERFLHRLYRVAKEEDPAGLVTYVNHPATEYLGLPFLDSACFDAALQPRERLEEYLARLQNLTGDRPLMMVGIGADSRELGEQAQALALDAQIRTVFAGGCAGAFVSTWSDQWIPCDSEACAEFGLTRPDRSPKPALAAARAAFADAPFPPGRKWPRISVVVCTYNGHRTIRDCFQGLSKLDYPNFEVILVDDGSTGSLVELAREYNFRAIRTENLGLSNARNVGMKAATGEIVAYIDDDAYPDPHWLMYLADAFLRTGHAGIGGPNIAPPGNGRIADCVANAPGGPVHVLLSDEVAEHIPGCNMAFRRAVLDAIGGFDEQFRVAGDDVDVCWRLQQQGLTLGFSPAAVVWHHRRNSLRAYWKQQRGYGRAEALLERKWPEKYNGAGHVTWAGRVYGRGLTLPLGRLNRVYHGIWGTAPFQSAHQVGPSSALSLLLMPEWYLIVLALAVFAALGLDWRPMLVALPLAALALGAPLVQACRSAARASFSPPPGRWVQRFALRALTAALHLMQPFARLWGRLAYGLSPWRGRGGADFLMPIPRRFPIWSETWQEPSQRLLLLENALKAEGALVARGGDFDHWDLEVRGGMFGAARLQMAVEEHGGAKQLLRFRCWPRFSRPGTAVALLFSAAAGAAAWDQCPLAAVVLGAIAVAAASLTFEQCSGAMTVVVQALMPLESRPPSKIPVWHEVFPAGREKHAKGA